MSTSSNNRPLLIFGSQSKFRRQIFNQHLKDFIESKGFEVHFMNADIDEKEIRHEDPREMVKLIARGKRQELIRQFGGVDKLKERNAIIFTTDQVAVCFNGEVREKPENDDEARAFLRSYSGSHIATFTAYLFWSASNEHEESFVEPTKTHFKEFGDEVIDKWLAIGDFQKAAGGFCVGEMLEHVTKIEGGQLAVEGLTPEVFLKLLAISIEKQKSEE